MLILNEIVRRPFQHYSEEESHFIDSYNSDIKEINKLIDEYNAAATPAKKREKLQALHTKAKSITYKYPTDLITRHAVYQNNINGQLFKNLKEGCSEVGLRSLSELDIDKVSLTGRPEQSFAEFIANMAPEKVASMLSILSAGEHWRFSDLNTLYRPTETGYSEFRALLASHTISYLGGYNSKNFKITPQDGKPFVLKVDNRLGMPRSVEATLRKTSLRTTLTPVYAERQATYRTRTIPQVNTTSTLLLTEFCEGKDLETHAATVSASKKIASALNIYSQMAKILMVIKDAHCLFPDMKNSNWLVSDSGIVRIADTKSFLFAKRTDGFLFWRRRFDIRDLLGDWCELLMTGHMIPPEAFRAQASRAAAGAGGGTGAAADDAKFSVCKFHSYQLGKNLYQYLTNCPFHYLIDKHNGADFDFSNPIFSDTAEGRQLKALIIALVKPIPSERTQLADAARTLETLHQQWQKQVLIGRCRYLLAKIKATNFGDDDRVINQYVGAKEGILTSTSTTISKLTTLKVELENMRADLTRAPLVIQIQSLPEVPARGISSKRNAIFTQGKALPLSQRLGSPPVALTSMIEEFYLHQEKIRECQRLLRQIERICARNQAIKEAFVSAKNDEINSLETLAPLADSLRSTLSQLTRINDAVDTVIERIRDASDMILMPSELLWRNEKLRGVQERILTVPIETTDERAEDLSRLALIEEQIACMMLLEKISQHGFEQDALMRTYKNAKLGEIKAATTLPALVAMKATLEPVLANLQNTMPEMKAIITDFHKNASCITRKMHAKANRIEEAMKKVPIEMRNKQSLHDTQTEATQNVRFSLASHRHFFKKDVYLKSDGMIDETVAAASYRRFFQL